MIKAPITLQELRRKIYVKAKSESQWKFWGLYIHICKMETLQEAYRLAKSNKGAPGIDGVTFAAIEAIGVEQYLQNLREELLTETYKPARNRKVEIPKANNRNKVRTLSIPNIRDRIVQGAVKLILEPIFEADFQDGSYGYRPKRKPEQAISRVAKAIVSCKTKVIDVDIRAYFDTVRHDILLSKIAERVQDGKVLRLIKLILKASGKRGVPQGGTVSCLFSNIYLNGIDSMLEKAKEATVTDGFTRLEYVRWADDLVILIDGFWKHRWVITAVFKRLKEELGKLGLELNEDKTKIVDLENPKGTFTFLGFNYRRVKNKTREKAWPLTTPTRAARIKLQQKLKEIFRRKRSQALKEVVAEINPVLRGWVNYFRIGNSSKCLDLIRDWTIKKVRRHVCRARNKSGFGWGKWSNQLIYQRTGLYNDYKIRHIA